MFAPLSSRPSGPLSPQRPIGIYDSGIGGLTVASAIRSQLPHEDFIYFGDTAHLPYGEKSAAAIQAYSIKICNLLLEQGVKTIVIACNSASAAAYELVKEYVGSRCQVLNVIDPMVDYVARNFAGKRVGLIGTRATVHSGVYKRKVEAADAGIELRSLATPLLASMIEEGFFSKQISRAIVEEYLQAPELDGIEALILGCTHYPLIKDLIEEHFGGRVAILDSSEIVARTLSSLLGTRQLLNEQPAEGQYAVYVSDLTESFQAASQLFFPKPLTLQAYPLWE